MSDTNKPALPEPVALYKKLRDIGSALRDAIPALHIETANAVMDQLNRLDDAANEISTAIAAAVAEARAVPALPSFVRRPIEQAIHAAVNPVGMSVHDGMARVASDKLAYLLAAYDRLATPSPAEQPKPAVRAEKLYDAIKEVLLHHRLSYTEGEDAEAFPLVDMLCPPGSRDISKGRDEITLICDAIYNDEAVRAAISGEQP